MKKCVIMGLDCAAPGLVFDKLKDRIPNITAMAEEGVRGTLRSSDPPITIPAWMSMMTGKDPGQLGLYGFRHRKDNSYQDMWIASSNRVKEKTLWDRVGRAGGRSCVVGVPPTYPPRKIDGWLISCFITPDTDRRYTHPPELGREIEDLVGEYVTDVPFRVEDRASLLDAIYDMTERRFKVVEYLIQEKEWDLFAFVEIGLDRMHHAFWKYFDPVHHLYRPGNEFENAIPDYYAYLDDWVGRLRESIPKSATVLIVSDHGAQPMKGAFCVNQWLAGRGHLAMKKPEEVVRFSEAEIDWSKTTAWGWGGYYARIFLNLEGREEQGTVPVDRYDETRDGLAEEIRAIRGPNGEEWNTQVIYPERHFDPCLGDPPDMMVYFDDLSWRSAGTVGHPANYLPENDTGPDDAVHAKNGIYIFSGADEEPRWQPANILDVAPTVLRSMGLPVPKSMKGEPICRN